MATVEVKARVKYIGQVWYAFFGGGMKLKP